MSGGKYLATLAGTTIGMFESVTDARIACERAATAGVVGYDRSTVKWIEVRDTTNAFSVVLRVGIAM